MKKKRFKKAYQFFYCIVFVAGHFVSSNVNAQLHVVTTLPDLAAIAKDIGGKHVSVKALASPKQDPHFVDPRPNLIVTLHKADLLIVNGLELEIGWLPPIQLNSRNAKIQVGARGFLDVSVGVRKMEIPQMKISRSQGDIHPGGNPHFTFDPRAALSIASQIKNRLEVLSPAHAKDFLKNLETFRQKTTKFINTQKALFAKVPKKKRKVISYHRSLTYLFDLLGLERVLNIEPQPGIAPNPSHVAHVLQSIRANQVSLIIQENYFPTNTSKTLAKLSGAKLVLIDGGTNFKSGESYLEHIQNISKKIYDAISK